MFYFSPQLRDTLTREGGIYFMKSEIDRHEVRSESGSVVSLEFGESSD